MVRDATTAAVEGQRVEDLEHTLESLRDDTEVSQVLLGLSAALAEVKTIEETLEKAVRIVPEVFGADRCFAACCDASNGRFVITAQSGFDEPASETLRALAAANRLPLLSRALQERRPFLIADAAASALLDDDDVDARGMGAYIGIPLVRWGEDFGGLGVEFSSPREFGPKQEALARGVVRQVGVALANARRFNLLRELRGVGLRVGSKLRLAAVVDEIAHGARHLLAGTGAAVYFFDSQHRSLIAAVAHGLSQEQSDELATIDARSELWQELLDKGTVEVREMRAAGMNAAAALIPGHGSSVLGAVAVFFDRPFRLGREEVEALQVLTAQASTAVENAQRFERQRRVARSLQEGLLATEMPAVAGCELGAVYEPASAESDVGGDYFDVLELPNGRFAIVVGDVSGKGAEAAAQTAMAKYMLRAFAIRNAGPSSVLFHLNNALVKGLGEDRFTTLVYSLFEADQRRCQVALGGHPPPLIYRAATRTVEALALEGSVLGIFDEQHFEQMTVEIGEGDVFLAYTDGLLEARNNGELYGRQRIERSLIEHADLPAQDLARRIYADARAFGSITDDTVVVALKCAHEA